ncbi:leucine-rich repeat-containing protein 25 [Aegotheles albertisi]
MGHPAAPLVLLVLVLRPSSPSSPCPAVPPDAPAELDLSNRSHQCSELDWGPFQRQRRLVLSRNGIAALSPSSRVGPGLEELDLSHNLLRELPGTFLSGARGLRSLQLQHNLLRELPRGFFANATALVTLRLEGNPLPAVPPSAFQPSLRLLALPCRCDVVGSVLAPCACSPPNCTVPRCRCVLAHRDTLDATEFHARECRRDARLVAGLAGAAGGVALLLLVAGVVGYRRRKAATGTAGAGWGKWEPAGAHGQSRYLSRDPETGPADGTAAPDYENVFVSPCTGPAAARDWAPAWPEQRHSPPSPEEDGDYFLGDAGDPDQPIYANTQSPDGDSIYITPGQ